MLTHPLYDQLRLLKLDGFLKGVLEQESQPDIEQMTFMDRLGLLLDR